MGYFKNVINEFKKTNLKLGEVCIAGELDSHGEVSFTDEEFEQAANYLYDYYISSEISAQELVDKFLIAYKLGEFELSDIDTDPDKVNEAIYNLL